MVSPSATRDSRADPMRAMGSRDPDEDTQWANAPSGMLRDDSVHAAQCTFRFNDAVTVRAKVVLPTPAAPTRTTPQLSVPLRAARMASCSAGRSKSCH